MEAMSVEQNIDYEFDENVEDYSDDVDYEADEAEQETTAPVNKKFKSSSEGAKTKDDKKDIGVYASLLETKYSDIKAKQAGAGVVPSSSFARSLSLDEVYSKSS